MFMKIQEKDGQAAHHPVNAVRVHVETHSPDGRKLILFNAYNIATEICTALRHACNTPRGALHHSVEQRASGNGFNLTFSRIPEDKAQHANDALDALFKKQKSREGNYIAHIISSDVPSEPMPPTPPVPLTIE